MAKLFGAITPADGDYNFRNTAFQKLVFDETQRILQLYNEEMMSTLGVWVVDGMTENHTEKYKLPGTGFLQLRGRQSAFSSVKAYGDWTVGYPLEDFGDNLTTDDVTMAKMNMEDWERHVQTVLNDDAETVRYNVLRAILNKNTRTVSDPEFGDITVQPLANGDSVVYPPVIASSSESTQDHYLFSGYASASISDSNNPVKTIVTKLEARFGTPTGGSNIAVFHHTDETDNLQGLTDYIEIVDRFVSPGDQVTQLPIGNIPGSLFSSNVTWRVHGRLSGATLCQWDRIPSGYLIGVHLDAPRPVKMRRDPARDGLGTGLQLVNTNRTEFPLEEFTWRHRFGVGVGNRLNGVAMFLTTGSSYDVPSGFAY